MTSLDAHITELLTIHAGTTYSEGVAPSTAVQLALRVRALRAERDEARSHVNLLRAAVQAHHDRHYAPITHCASRPVVATHDKILYDLVGIAHMKPEAFDHSPEEYRSRASREWRRQTDVLTVGAIVGEPEQGV